MDIIQNLFRTLMFFIDKIIYGLIPEIYKIFVYLSELNLYSSDEANPLYKLISHIYVLLGIFMLFKVSFSFLQYMVDPNSFRDSSKGIGKLVTNVLVALVLLVSVPFIFSFAVELQTKIVQSNAIGTLILGTSAADTSVNDINGEEIKLNTVEIGKMARDLQFMMYGPFYSLNLNDKMVGTADNPGPFYECRGTSGVFGSLDVASANDGKCLETLDTKISEYDDAASNGVNLYSFFKYSDENCPDGVCDARDFGDFDKLLWWKIDGEYVINYLPFISTAAGIYVVLLLVSFCVDIAVRTIKLCFLQMVAPIAIVSYIDPKESISNGKLHNWIKECATTYFSLFLRLATLFLVMLLISVISSSVLADGGYISGQVNDTGYSIWIYLFLVIGSFMFAQKVPGMIESIFGIKSSGDLNLNPFKTYNNARDSGFGVAAGLTGGLVGGFAGGAAANAIATVKNALDNRKEISSNFQNIKNAQHMSNFSKAKSMAKMAIGGVGGALGSSLAGGVSAGVRGAYIGGKNKKFFSAMADGRKGATEARNERDIRQATDYKRRDQIADVVAKFANIKNKAGGVGAMDQKVKDWTRLMNNAEGQEHAMRDQQSSWVGTETSHSFRDFQRAVFAPKLGQDGNVLMDADKNIIYDETKTKEYSEYLKSLQPGEKPIEQQEYEKFKSMQDDINMFDQTREYYRKQIKDYQDVIDMKGKNEK